METLSLVANGVSIVLGAVAIVIAVKESKNSNESYRKAEKVLKEIEHKSALMDKSLQIIQDHLLDMIKIAMERIGQSSTDLRPITKEEIDEILDISIPNEAGGNTVFIGKDNDIINSVKREFSGE